MERHHHVSIKCFENLLYVKGKRERVLLRVPMTRFCHGIGLKLREREIEIEKVREGEIDR